jgi:hypothetical protein
MTQDLLSAPGIDEKTKAMIAAVLPEQLRQRLLKIALKQLLRGKPELSIETLHVCVARYGNSVLAMLLGITASLCAAFRPLLALAGPAEAVEFKMLSFASQAAARRNGLAPIDIAGLRRLLQQTC